MRNFFFYKDDLLALQQVKLNIRQVVTEVPSNMCQNIPIITSNGPELAKIFQGGRLSDEVMHIELQGSSFIIKKNFRDR